MIRKRGNLSESTCQSREIYVEFGLVTESELQDLLGRVEEITTADKMKKYSTVVKLQDQLGNAHDFHLISLQGLPCREAAVAKKPDGEDEESEESNDPPSEESEEGSVVEVATRDQFYPLINGHSRNLNWRYLPYIRPL